MISNVIIVFILFLFWAFFAGTETAFISINRFKLYNLRRRGKNNARVAYFLLEKPGRLLSTTLLGTNIALVLSANLTARIFMDVFGYPKPLISIGTVTLLSFILCEVLPKNIALRKNLRWTLVTSIPLYIFYIFFYPVGKIFSFLSKLVIRISGVPHMGIAPGLFSKKEDVKFFLSAQLRARFSDEESRYFLDTLDFGEKTLSEVMIPLVEFHALPLFSKIRDCYDFIQKFQKFYIPVYRDRIDNIVGIVYARDLFDRDKNIQLSNIMKEPVFTPESKNINQLYRELYERDVPVVFAVDEYGGITGMATIYDIGEEIIGKIRSMADKSLIVKIREGEYLCDGDVEIDEINNLLSIDIKQEKFSTLNGLILHELGKIPEKGDTFIQCGYRFTVEEGSKKRAKLIRIGKYA